MKTVNTTQAKQCLDELLNNILKEPIAIQKDQKDFAVILSSERYQELLIFEDKYLHDLVVKVEQEGFIGVDASLALLDSI